MVRCGCNIWMAQKCPSNLLQWLFVIQTCGEGKQGMVCNNDWWDYGLITDLLSDSESQINFHHKCDRNWKLYLLSWASWNLHSPPTPLDYGPNSFLSLFLRVKSHLLTYGCMLLCTGINHFFKGSELQFDWSHVILFVHSFYNFQYEWNLIFNF
jgi:hypothetical protein